MEKQIKPNPFLNYGIIGNITQMLVETNNSKEFKTLRELSTLYHKKFNKKYFDWLDITIKIGDDWVEYTSNQFPRIWPQKINGFYVENWDPKVAHIFRNIEVSKSLNWKIYGFDMKKFFKDLVPFIKTICVTKHIIRPGKPRDASKLANFIETFENLKLLIIRTSTTMRNPVSYECFILKLKLNPNVKVELQIEENISLVYQLLGPNSRGNLKKLIHGVRFVEHHNPYPFPLFFGHIDIEWNENVAKCIAELSLTHKISNNLYLDTESPTKNMIQPLAPFIQRLNIFELNFDIFGNDMKWPILRKLGISSSHVSFKNSIKIQNFPNLEELHASFPQGDKTDDENLKFLFGDLKKLKKLSFFYNITGDSEPYIKIINDAHNYLKNLKLSKTTIKLP